MIGYYVHHHGSGHVHRATRVAQALGQPVTGLSSLPRPADWPGPWIQLDSDADGAETDRVRATASPRDRLHWVPLGHEGLRSRMGEIASWVRHVAPSVVVVDVSVEVALLVRLHGVPVVTLVQPGRRGDPAHVVGFDLADALVGCWPARATGMLQDVPDTVACRVEPVGGLARHEPVEPGPRRPGPCRVVLLSGTGGTGPDAGALDRARAETPGWEWTVLDRSLGTWVEDPAPLLREADVVVTHAGQNAIAEVAAARRPAVVVPQPRPHDEQVTTAAVLAGGGWPVVVAASFDEPGWAERLGRAAALDGRAWEAWCDGHAAERFAEVVRRTALA